MLLLVIANVGNLVLVQSTVRRREFAVRAALGARGGRLVRQLLTENLVLALVGGVLGVVLGVLGVRGVVGMLPTVSVPIPGEVAVNTRVLLFSTALALGAGLAFGLLPALRARRSDLHSTLQDEGHGTTGGSRLRLQRIFVGVEVALALVLLVGGGLLLRSFLRLQSVQAGFRTENVLTMRLTLPRERYTADRIEPFFRELVRRVEEIPGVERASTATQYPPVVFEQRRFWLEGAEPAGEGTLPSAYTTLVSPAYFETLGVPLAAGASAVVCRRARRAAFRGHQRGACAALFPPTGSGGQAIQTVRARFGGALGRDRRRGWLHTQSRAGDAGGAGAGS